MTFFQIIIEKMACSIESLTKKMEEVKINDDFLFGKDLSSEKKLEEKTEQDIPGSEISYFLRKRSIAICFEISKINDQIARDLLFKLDWLMDEYFFQENGLRELGWCSKYLLNRRSVKYHKAQQLFEKTEIVEFYWFNSSLNRFDNALFLTEVKLFSCMNCYFFTN